MEKKKKQNKLRGKNPKEWRNFIWYFLLGLMIISLLTTYFSPKNINLVDFSTFMQELSNGSLSEVTIRPKESILVGVKKNGEVFKSYYVDYPEFVNEIRNQGVKININPADSGWFLSVFLQAFLPFILIGGLWFFIFRQAQGANNQALTFGKSRVSPWKKKDNEKAITFKDVAGVDEAVEELHEIVEFLKQPEKFTNIGAKIPKGALLMGPPGTGKTLLAKAIAGEANVPFFRLSGSDFVEMFVGVGASRVRDLFKQAKKNNPSIIFVDELDAVGRHRGAGLGGGHDEREQTLNQLLVEMDGFDEKASVIVVAATNRPDILDPALLRPGRFDRQIVVDRPDIKGREAILNIHSKEIKLEKEINLEIIARRTPGFTGADLANLVNEGALLAARRGKTKVGMEDLEDSTERVMAGPEKKSRIISKQEKEVIAYHEVGHAIVAKKLKNTDPVHKISILPRGMALGYTLQLPIEDKHLITKTEIKNKIAIFMGGRVAEEIQFGEITSGAANDIERATDLARSYVCKYGMSEKLGSQVYGKSQTQVFLGRDYSDHSKDYSEETAKAIDVEIRNLISDAYNTATNIIKKNNKKLIEISKILIEKEVIDGEGFDELLSIKKVTKVTKVTKEKKEKKITSE
jgi:cell division protease FtsH